MRTSDRILFLGDSITRAAAVGPTQSFAYMIGAACGYEPGEVINAGVGGNTSAQVLARLQTDVIALAPDICVLMIGANDVPANVPVATFQANLSNIALQLNSAGISLTLLSCFMQRGDVTVFQKWEPYIDAGEEVVAQYGLEYIDIYRHMNYKAMQASSMQYYVDDIHPNVLGHQLIAEYCLRPIHKRKFIF